MAISIKNNRLHLQCRYAIVNWLIYAVMASFFAFAATQFWATPAGTSPNEFVLLFVVLVLVVVFYKLWHSAMKERLVELAIDRNTGALNFSRTGLLFSDTRQLNISDIERIEFRTHKDSNGGIFYRASMVFSDGDEVAFANGGVRDWVVAPAEKVVKFLRVRRGDLRLDEVQV